MIQEANRLMDVREYYFSKKLKEIKELNENGASIINIGIGSPDMGPDESVIKELCNSSTFSSAHAYQSYRGLDELRNALSIYYSRDYNVRLKENEILPLIGSKEGIMQITQAFINKGDLVLVPNPGYPTYEAVSNLAEAKVKLYELSEENDFQIDIEALKKMDLTKVKLMWINYPNMPTGAEPDIDVLQELINLAKENDFLIVNDNPYSRILTKNVFSIFQIEGAFEVCLELNSLSKSHNMAGWRIGCVLGQENYLKSILKVRTNVDSGMFYAIQKAAIKALELEQDWFDQLNQRYGERRKILFDLFRNLNCKYDEKQTGLFVWAKIPKTIENAELFVDELIHKTGVFITPGKIFGSQGERFLRASLCSSEETLLECVARVKKLKL